MASMKKYAGSRFLRLDDVVDQPRREKIAAVVDEGTYGKPILKFESGAQFSCNATNVGTLIAEFGEDSNDWLGGEIELYHGQVKFKGSSQDSVLIRAPKKAVDLNDEIPF